MKDGWARMFSLRSYPSFVRGLRGESLGITGWIALASIVALGGCKAKKFADRAVTTGPMPPNTVMLSAMMQELSEQPGFTDAFLREIEGPKRNAGAALLTPDLVHVLRDRILGHDWQGLDRFPGWTMREINPTVRVVGHEAGKDQQVEGTATAGGAPAGAPAQAGQGVVREYLDMGSFYTSGQLQTVDLDRPAVGKPFVVSEFVSSLGDGVTRGDGPNGLAPLHAESGRLAEVLNRLSLNGPNAAGAGFQVALPGAAQPVRTPEQLVAALMASGHRVMVADSRYFANFGHLHFKGQDVMMPFWVNPQIVVPGTRRPLLVPVSHAEYEWFISEPGHPEKMQAAVSFYFGIDGKAEWRTMDQLDQAWVMNRHAHEYRGGQAVEVTRLSGEMVRTYVHLHQAHPAMPFGGYYAFGVCQDVVAAIELKMTGKTTLFPNTADESFFTDPADAEINGLIRAIPKDRDGKPPQVERIFGSLPVGDSDAELARVSIPGLGADLVAVHDAWTDGTLKRVQPRWERWRKMVGGVLAGVVLVSVVTGWRKLRQRPGD